VTPADAGGTGGCLVGSTRSPSLRLTFVRPSVPYRKALKLRARILRRELTPAERRLWFEFLSGLPQKFTRQKPIGNYVGGENYDLLRTESLGLSVLRFTNVEVMQDFEAVCEAVLRALGEG
jgi:very-short-patch-repair endonuclease